MDAAVVDVTSHRKRYEQSVVVPKFAHQRAHQASIRHGPVGPAWHTHQRSKALVFKAPLWENAKCCFREVQANPLAVQQPQCCLILGTT